MSFHTATWFSSMGTEMSMLTGSSLCPRLFTCMEVGEGQDHAEPPALLDLWLLGPPPQQNLMVSHPLRQRSVSLDNQMGYLPAPGGMANLPF